MKQKLTLTISKKHGRFEVDAKALPGMAPIGRGRTMMEALGSFLHNARDVLGVEIDVDESAVRTEMRRRQRELAKR